MPFIQHLAPLMPLCWYSNIEVESQGWIIRAKLVRLLNESVRKLIYFEEKLLLNDILMSTSYSNELFWISHFHWFSECHRRVWTEFFISKTFLLCNLLYELFTKWKNLLFNKKTVIGADRFFAQGQPILYFFFFFKEWLHF